MQCNPLVDQGVSTLRFNVGIWRVLVVFLAIFTFILISPVVDSKSPGVSPQSDGAELPPSSSADATSPRAESPPPSPSSVELKNAWKEFIELMKKRGGDPSVGG